MSFGTTTNATYVYDVVNRLTKITVSANLAVTFAYDAAGKLTSKTLPNGVAATETYDGLDRLIRLKDAKGNTVIADNQYSYNSAGDITQNIDQSGTHGYGYDTIDRLTSATYTDTPNETYAYDGVGNRTSSHKSATYGYQPFNRLVSTSTATYIYNNNGNMVSKTEGTGRTQYIWDFENRLTQVVTPSSGSVIYKYDGLGRRIQRTPSSGVSTNFVYDGQDVVKDINSDGTTVEYLNGPGIDNKIRQKGSSTSTTYYFTQDHLGSTTALTGTTGKLVERITYDGYGNSAGSTRTRYSYTGRERDQLIALLYYRARFYDPQLGRFISEDPIGFEGGINLYAYVDNNAVNIADPFGLDGLKLPNRPSELPPEWRPDPSHGYGQRFRHPKGDILDFHPKNPLKSPKTEGGRDHWHHNKGKNIYIPATRYLIRTSSVNLSPQNLSLSLLYPCFQDQDQSKGRSRGGCGFRCHAFQFFP